MRDTTETKDTGSSHLWGWVEELGRKSPESDVRGIGL